ncbi:MAG: response regulator transcription factor [Verrucomicrobiota bacterium]
MIRVLVADDHEMILRGLSDGLEDHPEFELVAAVATSAEVEKAYLRTRPDVVLLDYRMPGANGDQITERLMAADPKARVIIFSSYEWEEDIWRSSIAGAAGYIPKSCPLEEVYEGIRVVAAGHQYFPPEILKKIRQRERRESLTKREQEILVLLARGMDNRGLAEELCVSEATVKTHVSRILAKIDANDRTHAVVKAAKRGLVRLEE